MHFAIAFNQLSGADADSLMANPILFATALSFKFSKKVGDPYLIPHCVLSITNGGVLTLISPSAISILA